MAPVRLKSMGLLFALLAFSPHSLPAQSTSPQSNSSPSPPPAKTQKVWTNEDLKKLKGPISSVGAPAAKSSHLAAPPGEISDDFSIVSPIDGTIVHTGETISIEVRVEAGKNVGPLAIVSPLGYGLEIRKSPPYTFTLQVPTDDTGMSGSLIGDQPIFAFGAANGKSGQDSAPVTVDVEKEDLPVGLSPQISGVSFESLGETFPLIVLAKFPDGSVLEVNYSTYVSYSSSNSAVATVDNYGIITATGPGNATIKATYRLGGQSVEMSLPVDVPQSMMVIEASPSSLDFGSQPIGATSESQLITLTNHSHGPIKIIRLDSGPVFPETNDCLSVALPPGDSCTVHVAFTPRSRGPARGNLVFWDNFRAVPTQIALVGTGE